MVDLDTTLSLRKPEVQVIVDREAASDLGIPVGTIADTLRDPRRRHAGLEVPRRRRAVRRLAPRPARATGDSTKDLYDLTLPSPTAGLVKLTEPGRSSSDERGPTEIERLSRAADRDRAGQPRGRSRWARPSTAPRRSSKEMNLPPQYSATSSPARPRRWPRRATTSWSPSASRSSSCT